MRYLSLFSGYGGFELGIQKAYERNAYRGKERGGKKNKEGNKGSGLQSKKRKDSSTKEGSVSASAPNFSDERPLCIGFSEIDKYAIETYQKHFPEHKNYGDITKIDASTLQNFDLLVGGFPCQSFSIAGKRRGFDDTRGTLFFEVARIVKEKKPRLLLLENVKGLLSHDKGKTFYTIISTLDELGYDIQWQVLNSKDFGVPQNRERVFIVGHLRGTPRPEVFPIRSRERLDTKSHGKRDESENCVRIPEATRKGYAVAREGDSINLSVPNSKTRRGRVGGGIAQTLDTGMQQYTMKDMKIRRLTPTECERLMGLPDGWTEGVSDTQRYKLCGNGVVVNVVEEIVSRLLY